jgi:hypothetical protein
MDSGLPIVHARRSRALVDGADTRSTSQESMMNNNLLPRLGALAAALLGVLFFFAIVGVFGLRLAIAGLAVFVLGAVVLYVTFPTAGVES